MKHIQRLELFNDGVAYDCAVMKQDSNGDIYFIRLDYLDFIDVDRLRGILSKREAQILPLWDLLSSVTLKNGMNALVYFHQFVQVRTASGKIMRPNPRRRGVGRFNQRPDLHAVEAQRERNFADPRANNNMEVAPPQQHVPQQAPLTPIVKKGGRKPAAE